MIEKWGKIKGFNYYVSSIGRVKNNKDKLLKPRYDRYGYLRVDLRKDNKSKTIFIHRLVAETFLTNNYNKKFVNHINGDKNDNSVNNLEFVTALENNKHAIEIGKRSSKNYIKNYFIEVFEKSTSKNFLFKNCSEASVFFGYSYKYFSNRIIAGQFENKKYIWKIIKKG